MDTKPAPRATDAVYFLSWPGHPELKRITPAQAAALWERRLPVLGVVPAARAPAEVTLVTVIRADLNVLCTYACRLAVKDGRVDEASVSRVCNAVRDASKGELKAALEMGRREAGGLPGNARRQLAVCLDEPAAKFRDTQPGGPLALARIGQADVAEVVRFLCQED